MTILLPPFRGLELALQSLHLSILRYNPRPVLLFYGDDVPAAESAKEVIDGVAPPAIRDLIEVGLHSPGACARCPIRGIPKHLG